MDDAAIDLNLGVSEDVPILASGETIRDSGSRRCPEYGMFDS